MGLDTSHDCWHGPYSAFTRWRNEVARAAGYQVGPNRDGFATVLIDWDQFPMKNYQGEWDKVPDDPLILLIAHSDCDGVIYPEHAALLADRLTELLPLLKDSHHVYRQKTEQFIRGLRSASERGEKILFQ